jgi:hypothetical protein
VNWRSAEVECSAAQLLLLTLGSSKVEPGLAIMFYATELRGPLDVVRLRESWKATIYAHPALHTCYRMSGGTLEFRQAASTAIDWRFIDMANLTAARATEVATDERNRHQRAAFDLAEGRLARATLLALAPDHHMLLASFHHAAIDGWGLDVFSLEWSTRYNAEFKTPHDKPEPVETMWATATAGFTECETLLGAENSEHSEECVQDTDRDLGSTLSRACARLPETSYARLRTWARSARTTLHATMLVLTSAVIESLGDGSAGPIATLAANRTATERGLGIGAVYEALLLACPRRVDASIAELARETLDELMNAAAHLVPYADQADHLLGCPDALPKIMVQSDRYPLGLLRLNSIERRPLPMCTGETWPVDNRCFDWGKVSNQLPDIRAANVANLTIFGRAWQHSFAVTAFTKATEMDGTANAVVNALVQAIETLVEIPDITFSELLCSIDAQGQARIPIAAQDDIMGGVVVEHLSPIPARCQFNSERL